MITKGLEVGAGADGADSPFLARKWWGLGAGARFFVSLAVSCLIPVIALGALLAQQYRRELRDCGVAQGQLQAALISRLITDTQLSEETTWCWKSRRRL
jgi:hypothetical protein